MKRAAIYCRTPEGQDLDDQLTSLRVYCEQQGWEVVKQYHDRTLLGAKDKRKQQDILLRDARNHEFDVVVVLSLSAWGKSLKHLVDSMTGLKQQGVSFVSLQDRIDPDTVDALKSFMKAQKSEKVKAGMMIARLRGLQIGRTPLKNSQVASIISCFEQGDRSVRDVARLTGTPRSSVHSTLKKYRQNGNQSVQ
jgi:DNA invertase Pin-like site-specific DNA recombinase